MTNEMKSILKKIDVAFTLYFLNNKEVESIFVVGDMAKDDYHDQKNNDYDIKIISNKVTKEDLENFEHFLSILSKNISTESIEVEYLSLLESSNERISSNKKNILINAMLEEKCQMDDFLPETKKYQYGIEYRIVSGIDLVKRFEDIRFTLDDIVTGYEGINYYIDMLKQQEYRYITWDIEEHSCRMNLHTKKMTNKTMYESCINSVNTIIINLMNYCNFSNYKIPSNKMDFTIKLLGEKNLKTPILFLLDGVYNKDELLLKNIFDDIIKETINILEIFKERVYELDYIFTKKEEEKKHKLIRS